MEIEEKIKQIIEAGYKAVDELIKVAEESIVTGGEDDLSADRLKNAAVTKKIAVFDAFEILNRINEEKNRLEGTVKKEKKENRGGFAERRSR